MLGHAAAHLDDGRLLKGVGADDRGADLAGDRQHGDAVELGVGDGRDQVGRPRSAGGHADADLAGAAGVSLGGKPAPLLVARQNDADLTAKAGQSLVQWDAGPARIGENRIHAVVHQRLHHDIGAARARGILGLGRARPLGGFLILVVLVARAHATHLRLLPAHKGGGFMWNCASNSGYVGRPGISSGPRSHRQEPEA